MLALTDCCGRSPVVWEAREKYMHRIHPLSQILQDSYLKHDINNILQWILSIRSEDAISAMRPIVHERVEYVLKRKEVGAALIKGVPFTYDLRFRYLCSTPRFSMHGIEQSCRIVPAEYGPSRSVTAYARRMLLIRIDFCCSYSKANIAPSRQRLWMARWKTNLSSMLMTPWKTYIR